MALRAEIIRRQGPDGGVILFDPLLDRLHHLDARQAAQLDAPDQTLHAWLQAAMLVEGPAADALRTSVLAARQARPAQPPPALRVPTVDWSQAEDLPDGVSPRWRDGESLRRKAEDRAAGRQVIVLEAFLARAFVEVLEHEVRALPRQRLETDLLRGTRARVRQGLPALREILAAPQTRTLLGAVLGVELPGGLELNAWLLEPGDHMRVHPDGPRYRATCALGLNADWTARDGGAIAWGEPSADGSFAVRERWLPHRGDLCLFVPHATSWHQVESPRRTRWTVSGWWVRP